MLMTHEVPGSIRFRLCVAAGSHPSPCLTCAPTCWRASCRRGLFAYCGDFGLRPPGNTMLWSKTKRMEGLLHGHFTSRAVSVSKALGFCPMRAELRLPPPPCELVAYQLKWYASVFPLSRLTVVNRSTLTAICATGDDMDRGRDSGWRGPLPAAADRARARLVRVCRCALAPHHIGRGAGGKLHFADMAGLGFEFPIAVARGRSGWVRMRTRHRMFCW